MKQIYLASTLLLLATINTLAVTTTSTTLSPSIYTDLGAGPLLLGIGTNQNPLRYQVADTIPSPTALGYTLLSGQIPVVLTTTSHIWAIAPSSAYTSVAITSPISIATVTPSRPIPNLATGAYSAVTVGTSDSTIVAASTANYILDIVNTSPTATICVNIGTTATITGTSCAAGEISIPPLWHRSWENSFIPTDAIHAVASAASTPASVGVK